MFDLKTKASKISSKTLLTLDDTRNDDARKVKHFIVSQGGGKLLANCSSKAMYMLFLIAEELTTSYTFSSNIQLHLMLAEKLGISVEGVKSIIKKLKDNNLIIPFRTKGVYVINKDYIFIRLSKRYY